MWHQVPFFESLVWLDLGLDPGLLDHWWTLYSLGLMVLPIMYSFTRYLICQSGCWNDWEFASSNRSHCLKCQKFICWLSGRLYVWTFVQYNFSIFQSVWISANGNSINLTFSFLLYIIRVMVLTFFFGFVFIMLRDFFLFFPQKIVSFWCTSCAVIIVFQWYFIQISDCFHFFPNSKTSLNYIIFLMLTDFTLQNILTPPSNVILLSLSSSLSAIYLCQALEIISLSSIEN